LLGGLVNLDLAVVVSMPLALEIARRHHVSPAAMSVAIAVIANVSSTLLPTSNLTTLLVLGRTPIGVAGFLAQSWLPWLLTTAVTVTALTVVVARTAGDGPVVAIAKAKWRVSTVGMDLLAMFLVAAGVRAWIEGIAVHGGLLSAAAKAGLLAAIVNNLPAAAAVDPKGTEAGWGPSSASRSGRTCCSRDPSRPCCAAGSLESREPTSRGPDSRRWVPRCSRSSSCSSRSASA
jgi:Na+/H+ antiporter NhaD/arsenite permease-like protein